MAVACILEISGATSADLERIVRLATEQGRPPMSLSLSGEPKRVASMVMYESRAEMDPLISVAREFSAQNGLEEPTLVTYDLGSLSTGDSGPSNSGLDYYEQAELWNESSAYSNSIEQERAEHLARLVAGLGAKSVLDAGAGNGIVANRLDATGLHVVALDHSTVAMERVLTEKVVGTVDRLPFESDSFDLVLASEVLEHLPNDVFDATRKELGRVARRFVVVTVPNSENLYVSGSTCPSCHARSSPWRHMQAFRREDLGGLIPGFRTLSVDAFGPDVEYRRRWETILTREVLNRWAWPANAVCPQCGFQLAADQRRRQREVLNSARPSPQSRLMGHFRRRVPKWLVGTYESGSAL